MNRSLCDLKVATTGLIGPRGSRSSSQFEGKLLSFVR